MPSFKTQMKEVFNNEMFFYFIAFLFGTNAIGYVALGKYDAIVIMAIVGAIAFNFNNNLGVVMLITIVATSLLMAGRNRGREGMEGDDKNKDEKKKKIKNAVETPAASTSNDAIGDDSNSDTDVPAESSGKSAPSVIDNASTISVAYSDLQKILGPGGIKGLTADTQELIGQQKELFDSMNVMAPAVKEAQEMLKNLDISGLDVSGLSKMLNNASPVA
jgi:hypothetical protein